MRRMLGTAAMTVALAGFGVSAASACDWDAGYRSTRAYGYAPAYRYSYRYAPAYSYYGYDRGYYGYGPSIRVGLYGYDGRRYHRHRHWH